MPESGPDPPLSDYDQLTFGDLEHRVRSLDARELERLLAYEREHADRAQVVELILFRLRQVAAGERPSPGGLGTGSLAPPPQGGSPVGPETSPEPCHPPPHGTPHQPGRPKGDRH
ncbi:hypothetical protein [Streptomyces boncukensis]|uniref:DUF8129 domain-containing protein n=1 Tax=Streptomyces boncukensis TaxID=2711219 RepID=A0A6G4X022_9ACTN|nr:hypothetical protein [Streptomyces boncukensis]NGO70207.1 hypothetical protein [Streptomyces boncukensis]